MKHFYLPVIKSDANASASVVSHKLMLRAGMIRQVCQGIYNILPLGQRVIKKIVEIIEEECDREGCQQVIMPTIQPSNLWEKSGRYNSYGPEMLRIRDRHNKEFLYGPTHEEVITDLLTKDIVSYKNLPVNLYQIHWKFRDEIRPRFGLMRCREFLMFDAYSFDMTPDAAVATYYMYYRIYLRIFGRMGVFAMPMSADTGQIGGSLSHEFQIIAETGESEVIYDIELEEKLKNPSELAHKDFARLYAVTKEKHEPSACKVSANRLVSKRGIEVGHIFSFGQKYSSSMELKIQNEKGETVNPYMGSYGIGVTRLMAALVEAQNDERGIIWDESVAPFKVILFNFDQDIKEVSAAADDMYNVAMLNNVEILYDDTDSSIGQKRNTADLIGVPYQICFGQRNMEDGNCELKNRKSGIKTIIPIERVKNELSSGGNLGKFFQ